MEEGELLLNSRLLQGANRNDALGQRLNITISLFPFSVLSVSPPKHKMVPRNWHKGGKNCDRISNSADL